jgi:predicted nucleic acid-binding protein
MLGPPAKLKPASRIFQRLARSLDQHPQITNIRIAATATAYDLPLHSYDQEFAAFSKSVPYASENNWDFAA